MTENHPFVVSITFEDRVDHVFMDTREQAIALLKSIHESYKDGISAMTDDCVISLIDFRKAIIIQKPADVPDAKWLG